MDNSSRDYKMIKDFAEEVKRSAWIYSNEMGEGCEEIVDETLEDYEAPGDTWFVTAAKSNLTPHAIKHIKTLIGSEFNFSEIPLNTIIDTPSGRASAQGEPEIITSVMSGGANAAEAFIKAFAIITKFLEEQNESEV